MNEQEMEKFFETVFDRPIAYHSYFTKIGGVACAVMLSQACYWLKNKTTKERGGWFYKTREEWKEETGLSRYEQESSRKKLVKLGILEEQLRGVPATMWFRVNLSQIFSWWKTDQLVGGKLTNKVAVNQPTIYTEITTKTTKEEKIEKDPLEIRKELREQRKARKSVFGPSFKGSGVAKQYPPKKPITIADGRGIR